MATVGSSNGPNHEDNKAKGSRWDQLPPCYFWVVWSSKRIWHGRHSANLGTCRAFWSDSTRHVMENWLPHDFDLDHSLMADHILLQECILSRGSLTRDTESLCGQQRWAARTASPSYPKTFVSRQEAPTGFVGMFTSASIGRLTSCRSDVVGPYVISSSHASYLLPTFGHVPGVTSTNYQHTWHGKRWRDLTTKNQRHTFSRDIHSYLILVEQYVPKNKNGLRDRIFSYYEPQMPPTWKCESAGKIRTLIISPHIQNCRSFNYDCLIIK